MRSRVFLLAAAMSLSIPATALADVPHVVAPGESLSSVAAADGLTVEELAAANGLSPEQLLIAGSTVMVPSQATGEASAAAGGETGFGTESSAVAPAAATGGDGDGDADDVGTTESAVASVPGPAASTGSYVVQPGDTLSAVAARAGTTVEDIAAANGVDPSALLLSGTVLNVSGASNAGTQVAAGTSEAATAQPVGTGAEGSPEAPPYPTAESLSPTEVGSIAAEGGVPPSLAEAIAQQESGFNNSLTSSADARGEMQILPGTWSWINESLAGSTPLAPASASSNVRGGVLLLNSLLNATGGNEDLAAAGYYQGLPSVLSEGEFPSTQQYVEDVHALKQQFGGE